MNGKRMPPVHPGEILLEEFFKPLYISQYKLARDFSVPPRRINEIVHGIRSVTADTALRLLRYFRLSERFRLNLQSRYDLEAEKVGSSRYAMGKSWIAAAGLDSAGPHPLISSPTRKDTRERAYPRRCRAMRTSGEMRLLNIFTSGAHDCPLSFFQERGSRGEVLRHCGFTGLSDKYVCQGWVLCV